MVGHAGEELAVGAVRDLIHADEDQPVQSVVVELVGHHPLEDLAHRAPCDPHQPRDRGLVHLLRQERGHVLEIPGVRRAGAAPRDPLIDIAAARAVQPPQHALDHAPRAAEIEMPPALAPVLLDVQAARAAARAGRLPRLQSDGHDHSLGAERHIPDPCALKREHPVECGSDPHVALLRRPLDFEHPAACLSGRRRVARRVRNLRDVLTGPSPPGSSGAARRASSGSLDRPTRTGQLLTVQVVRPLDPGSGSAIWQPSPATAGIDQTVDRSRTISEFTPKRAGVPEKGGELNFAYGSAAGRIGSGDDQEGRLS